MSTFLSHQKNIMATLPCLSISSHDYPHYTPEHPHFKTEVRQETKPSNETQPESIPAATWENTLKTSINSIVSIKATRVRCLDTEAPGAFTATGFVVDPKRGIILSNRHVVSVSPIVAQAIFCNYEEVELTPIYRDPVHDFGFLKYDPSRVRFLNVPGIELYPEGARVGQEIRVVGNDAGEKLSILSGTLARLDRQAPDYGIGEYNDFNTFYLQAASGTSAGSSGSPVLDLHGRAIALNAGGATHASSSYYLPLNRLKRALECIQADQPVSRGTLQTEFIYRSYDELSRLGLSQHIEQRLRIYHQESVQGLLVVKSVLPRGPAENQLVSGDILLTGNGRILTHFLDLAELLDTHVGKTVDLIISRGQGQLRQVKMLVEDLHKMTPNQYVEFGGGLLHDLSYQIARAYGLSLKNPGVYVAASGYILGTAGALRTSVIVGLDNKKVCHLKDFIDIVSKIPQGQRVSIRYYSLSRPLKERVMVLHVDHIWHKFRRAIRNDTLGVWEYENLDLCFSSSLPAPLAIDVLENVSESSSPLQRLTKSLVAVDSYPPYVIDGLRTSHSYGAGVVVSLDPPLIVCDRDTVPVSITTISLTFGGSVTLPARLLFLHPFYNYAILTFDPSPVLEAGIEIHSATLSEKEIEVDDAMHYVGLGGNSLPQVKDITISALKAIRTKETSPPRWRAMNVEAYKTNQGSLNSQGGVLADEEGKVQACWMSFSMEDERGKQTAEMGGLPIKLIAPVLDRIRAGETPYVRGLEAEFWTMQLANARLLGLPDHWLHRYNVPGKYSGVLYIIGITNTASPCAKVLDAGDILLLVNGHTVTSVSDLAQFSEEEELSMTLFRNGKEIEVTVQTSYFDGHETTRVIGWQGMLIQNAYQAAKEQMQKQVPEGLYVSCCLLGSPAQVSLEPGVWITEINQQPVHTLDEFLAALQQDTSTLSIDTAMSDIPSDLTKDATWLLESPDQNQSVISEKKSSHVHVKYVTGNNSTHVAVLRLDQHYWPTWQIQKSPMHVSGWHYSHSIEWNGRV
ncbi:hypothetical protein BDF14DRAFT_1776366 [Spinellus fusiger]|nr:hypothetical protein BDF14DRAFT_1776366 [Spinellus fusiger]